MACSQTIGEGSDNPVAINVTAMVDVIFCLCIFFMCSFHFKQTEGSLDTWLPKDAGLNESISRGDVLVKSRIRIVLTWDPARGASTRRVEPQPPAANDGELMGSVLEMARDYDRTGHADWSLVIKASRDVPWEDVVHVMDLCKRNQIERIELGGSGVEED
jgi:biopolymer transport protein ExbD